MSEEPPPPPPIKLSEVRAQIDEIDAEIARLVQRRASIVDEVRMAKASAGIQVYDPEREDLVIERATSTAAGPFPRSAMRAVFREIISGCVALQEPTRITYLGPSGTFTENAARALFGSSASFIEAATIDGVLDSISRRVAAYGVIPFETSADGVVLGVVESFIARSLKIRREYITEVAYCLCSKAASLSEVRRVYAHQNTLGQCRRWLLENLPHADLVHFEPADSIAKAQEDPTGAALASPELAEKAGMRILARGTSDRADNAIRFVVVGREDGLSLNANRTTIALRPRPGVSLTALFAAVAVCEVELVRLASLPGPSDAPFLVFEVNGSRSERSVATLLVTLVAEWGDVHVLGSYAAHRRVSLTMPPGANPVRLDPA